MVSNFFIGCIRKLPRSSLIKLGQETCTSPAFVFAPLILFTGKQGAGMIIVQKTPLQIKQFLESVKRIGEQNYIQQYTQKIYTEECLALDCQWQTQEGLLFCFQGMKTAIPSSIIHSSDQKRCVIENEFEITLSLYQLRSRDRKHHEDILVDPFYPGRKATLYDIYHVLIQGPSTHSSSLGKPLSYRIQYNIRKNFTLRWQSLFGNTSLPLETFDGFCESIHKLNAEQLFILFGTHITFCHSFVTPF